MNTCLITVIELISFYNLIILYCLYIPQFVYPFTFYRASWLPPHSGSYESSCCKYPYTSFFHGLILSHLGKYLAAWLLHHRITVSFFCLFGVLCVWEKLPSCLPRCLLHFAFCTLNITSHCFLASAVFAKKLEIILLSSLLHG